MTSAAEQSVAASGEPETPAVPEAPATGGGDSFRMIFLLTLVSLICGMSLVFVYQGTLEPIKRNRAFIMQESVRDVLPGTEKLVIYAYDKSKDELTKKEGLDDKLPMVFATFDKEQKFLGVAFQAEDRGYGDVIKALCAFSPETQTITGFKVLEMKETPGLGDKIASDKGFLENFKELAVTLDPAKKQILNPVKTVKHGTKKEKWEIDAISGATISSKAVGRMIKKSSEELVPVIMRDLDKVRKGS